jgi:hypothetical protein
LNQLSKGSKEKYPLVALIEPFEQVIDNNGVTVKLRFLIATWTEKTIKADERLNPTYRGILFPVCEALTNELKRVTGSAVLAYKQVNHFEMGRESLQGYDGAILNDNVDVVELKEVKMYFRDNHCKTSNL